MALRFLLLGACTTYLLVKGTIQRVEVTSQLEQGPKPLHQQFPLLGGPDGSLGGRQGYIHILISIGVVSMAVLYHECLFRRMVSQSGENTDPDGRYLTNLHEWGMRGGRRVSGICL